ncbi:DUF2651 domain-containing protein [Lentibacillus cibarius]|uniref:DUF2651 domain-containing protein n=2 Tax=Lentibacillus TaxID=175304 RepID=A0A0U4EAE2_9BACI|nr:hypothetical protein AOX59_02100 [Lentibacillus amyloliquefaciens]TRM11415.1 DUF2651 domain-containing protein [Lentibacillus cibarius]
MFLFILVVFFVLPIVSLVLGAIGYFVFKNIYITPGIIAIATIVATFTVFNSSFWFWSVLYTMLSLISGVITKLLTDQKSLHKRRYSRNGHLSRIR